MTESCDNCRFWLPDTFPSQGRCRRRAPTPNEGGVKWVWTLADDWCGEHQPSGVSVPSETEKPQT